MALDVMRHRLVLSFEALSDNVTADHILEALLVRVSAPVVPMRESSHDRVSA
jgi:MoxR-like ATPase